MENIFQKYDLISKTGRWTPETERRRTILCSLLTEDAEIPGNKTVQQFVETAAAACRAGGLPIGGDQTIWLTHNLMHIRYAWKWINLPDKRHPQSEAPGYAKNLWERLQKEFPYFGNGKPSAQPTLEKEEPLPLPPPLPVEETKLDPIRVLAEAHAKIFSDLAGSYERIFQEIFSRLDRLEAQSGLSKAPPVIPVEEEAALPEASKRYFEFSMPEKTNYGLAIIYTERFRRSYKKMPAGLHWQVSKALEQLATLGMRYPGLGFKRLATQRESESLQRTNCRLYHFRVQRTWRIIVNVDNVAKLIWVETLASHNDKLFYKR